MNILMIVKNMEYENGGVCTQILTLSKEFISRGHKVVLVADGNDFMDETCAIGIQHYDNVKMKKVRLNPCSLIKAYKQIKKIVKKEKINIIHCHSQSALPIACAIKAVLHTPYVWTNHIDDIPQPQVLKLFHHIMKFPIISVSDELKQDMKERFSVDKKYITVIYNGIDLEKYQPLTEDEKAEMRKELSINPKEYNICVLARIAYNKGQDIMVRALRKLENEHKDIKVHLILAGSIEQPDWYEKNVQGYIKKEGIKVSYVGFRSPRDMFGVSDLFVLPSRKEGFPMACVEALAMKCPVVRTSTPGWRAMREYCRVTKIDDVDGLAQAIWKAYHLGDQTRDMTQKGYETVQTRLNSIAMSEETLKVYDRILTAK